MRNKIKELLTDRGWSLYKLSKESKVSASTLHDFLVTEKIKSLGIDKLERIAKALGVPFDFLLGEEKDIEVLKTEQYKFIPDENIRMIARAGEFMTKEQAEELRKLAERLYGDAFEKL